jgi:hypothetical protein
MCTKLKAIGFKTVEVTKMNNLKSCISKLSPCALVLMALVVGVANINAATERAATPSPAEVFSTLPSLV